MAPDHKMSITDFCSRRSDPSQEAADTHLSDQPAVGRPQKCVPSDCKVKTPVCATVVAYICQHLLAKLHPTSVRKPSNIQGLFFILSDFLKYDTYTYTYNTKVDILTTMSAVLKSTCVTLLFQFLK